jgi:hypothetical protein
MFDRIFNQRLQQEVGNLGAPQLGGDIQAHLQALSKANFLDVNIALQVLNFLLECYL